MAPKTLHMGYAEPSPFEKCYIHPKSESPCTPTPGWHPEEIRDCPRVFIDYDGETEFQRVMTLEGSLAGYIELILEERPNQAVQVLDNCITNYIGFWESNDAPEVIDTKIRLLFEECVRVGYFINGFEIPKYLHNLILTKPIPAIGKYHELPPDKTGSWVMQTAEAPGFVLGKTFVSRMSRHVGDALQWKDFCTDFEKLREYFEW